MGKAAKIGVLALALIVVTAGAFFLLFDANQFRGTIQAQLESSLKRKVSLGAVHLGLFPLALRIENVSIGENPALVKANELSIRAALLPLLSKRVEIRSLRLVEPVIELVETSAGHWNYETPGGDSSGVAPRLSIDELVVENGRVAVTAAGAAREVYEHIDLHLQDFAPGRTFTADLAMLLPHNLKLEAALRAKDAPGGYAIESMNAKLGQLRLTGAGTWSDTATDLKLKVDRSSIADLAQVAASFGKAFSPDMKVAGDLSADIRLAGPSNKLAYAGTVELTGLEVRGPGWAQPVRIPAARADLSPTEIRTNTFTVESGSTKLTASALINEYASDNGDFQAALRAPSADLGELLHMAAMYGGASVAGISATGQASLDVKLSGKLAKDAPVNYAGAGSLKGASVRLPSLTRPIQIADANLRFSDDRISVDKATLSFGSSHATGNVSVRGFARPQIQFDAAIDQVDPAELQSSMVQSKAAEKKQPMTLTAAGSLSIGRLATDGLTLRNIQTKCNVKDGVIVLDPLTTELAGGRQTGALTIDTRPANTTYALRTKVDRVDANQLLSATTSLKQMLFGLLAAEADLRYAPKPGEQLGRSLNGTVGLRLTEGKLAGINMVNEMAGLAKLLGFRKQGEAVTNILGLSGNLQLKDGLASTNDLKMTFDGGSLAAAGSVNLADQSVNMKLTTVMSRAFTEQFASNKIGGLLTTALTNKNGELVIPSLVSGSMAKPLFAPDAAEMAKLRVQGIVPNLAPGAGNVAGAIEAAKKGGAKGVLEAITGRGKPAETDGKDAPKDEKAKPPQPPQEQSPAQSIIDLFKKKKQ